MEKNLNLFFADELRKRTLTEEQSVALQDALFPAHDDTPQSLSKAALDMAKAYEQWRIEEAKKPQPPENVKPITDAEADALAAGIY